MEEEHEAAKRYRQRLEKERRDLHGPSLLELAAARRVEAVAWKRTLPFYLRPWFWILFGSMLMMTRSIAIGMVGFGVIVVHSLWYGIAKARATSAGGGG